MVSAKYYFLLLKKKLGLWFEGPRPDWGPGGVAGLQRGRRCHGAEGGGAMRRSQTGTLRGGGGGGGIGSPVRRCNDRPIKKRCLGNGAPGRRQNGAHDVTNWNGARGDRCAGAQMQRPFNQETVRRGSVRRGADKTVRGDWCFGAHTQRCATRGTKKEE